jgi:hypothetical protein
MAYALFRIAFASRKGLSKWSNQAVRIPREFELPGDEAIVRKGG